MGSLRTASLIRSLCVALLAGLIVACGTTTDPTNNNTTNNNNSTASNTNNKGCITPASASFTRPFEVDAKLFPFDSCAYKTKAGTLHYIDAGPKDAKHTVLMVHGNPTWSFLYRNIAQALIADGHRVVIPDHIGMGMSDVPSTSEFDYRPRSHSKHLEDLVVALHLQNITLVVQDWGGPIGLNMATKQPDRIGRILIMNTWAWSVDPKNPGQYHRVLNWYNQVKQAKQMIPDFFCKLALPGQAEIMAKKADPTQGDVYNAVLSAYLSPAMDPKTREYKSQEPCAPMQIFAESIIDDNAFQGEVQSRLTTLKGKPYALLFGLKDNLFGALRCNWKSDTPCPGEAKCGCDPELLPLRLEKPDCAAAEAKEFHVCKTPDGKPMEPYADRFEELLGRDSLVLREAVTTSDHMVQEDAPDRVIHAIQKLIAAN